MDNGVLSSNAFIVAPYPARPNTPWKVEVRAAFAGKKIRRFCGTEAEAWSVGMELVRQIRQHGICSLGKAHAGVPMKNACETFAAHQKAASRSHRDKVDQMCRMLVGAFSTVQVDPAKLSEWFNTLPGTETTRAMYYRYMRMFFRWAAKMQFLDRDPSEVIRPPKAAVGRNILAPQQMVDLLAVDTTGWMRACLLLGGFAGLRTEELMRMDWADIDVAAGEIEVRRGVMKDSGGFAERIVDFTDPLRRRIDQLTGEGKLVPVTPRDFHYTRRVIAQQLGWASWPDNCLRHSFATYHLATTKNAGKTAFQMGHTNPSMVQRVYAVPAKKADAAAWWSI